MKHTPEPWTLYRGKDFIAVEGPQSSRQSTVPLIARRGDKDLFILAFLCYNDDDDHSSEVRSNFDRIVACVNGCEGINPEAVKGLLEACKDALPLVESLYLEEQEAQQKEWYFNDTEKLKAAIANAEK